MPKKGGGYFDKSARQYFATAHQKRSWLRSHGMRESGELYRPQKAAGGLEGSTRKHSRRQTCWKTEVSQVRPDDV